MTAQQKKYAVQRIQDLATAKINATGRAKKYVPFEKPTTAEIIEEYDNKYVPITDLELSHVSGAGPLFCARYGSDFCEAVTKLYEKKQREFDEANKNPNPTAHEITLEAERLCDQVMLGDADEALKMIEAFAAKEF